jgi:uncharacterized protein involved in exopolysaccharide biosynthesis
VTSGELIIQILKRLKKFRFLILLVGIGLAGLFYWYASKSRAVYTSRATVFPLTSSADNSAMNSTLSGILGISEAPKSFSSEASINIIELALSRNTREAVALVRLPDFGNKTIAELLIATDDEKSGKKTKIPSDTILANIGGTILKAGTAANINKNGVLVLTFSSTNEKLVSPISYAFVDKISEFYRELRIGKAKLDYDFTVKKVDSLDAELKKIDEQAIKLANSSYFTPTDRLEYNIPKDNLNALKERTMRQRDVAANNREEALWRLQKQTPIIKILDRPDPPFDKKQTSKPLFTIVGFFLGLMLTVLVLVGGLVGKYIENELQKALFKVSNKAAAPEEAAPAADAEQPLEEATAKS